MQDEKPACYPRRRFTSNASATAAAGAIYRRDRKSLRAKRCNLCGGYHLE